MHPDHDLDANPGASSDEPTKQDPGAEVTGGARAAEDAIHRLARLTVDRPSMTPADIDVVLAHLAAAVAALPQVAAQLGDILDQAKDDYRLAMDSMTTPVDPAIAIDTARLHLDAVREPAIDLYRRLDAAHNETAHISATPHDDELHESQPPAPGARHRRPEDHQRPGAGDHRPGPAR